MQDSTTCPTAGENNYIIDLLGNNSFVWSFWISAIFLMAFMLMKYYAFKRDSANDFGDFISEFLIDLSPIILSIVISKIPSVGHWYALFFMALTVLSVLVCSIFRNQSLHLLSSVNKDNFCSKIFEILYFIAGIVISCVWVVFAYIGIVAN